MSSDIEDAHESLMQDIWKINSSENAKRSERRTTVRAVRDSLPPVNLEPVLKKIGGDNLKGKLNPLAEPLDKPKAKRIQRAAGYENVTVDVNRWDGLVNQRRIADQLTFPLERVDCRLVTTEKNFRPSLKTDLEKEIYGLLQGAKLLKEKQETEEEKSIKKAMSLKEIREKSKILAKERALKHRLEKKAALLNKSKSRKYHKIVRREKLKMRKQEFETLKSVDPEAAMDILNEIEKIRLRERMNLRHKNSKWLRLQRQKAGRDDMMRDLLKENADMRKEILEKLLTNQKESEETEDDPDDLILRYQDEAIKSGKFDSGNAWVSQLAVPSKETLPEDSFIKMKKYWEGVKEAKMKAMGMSEEKNEEEEETDEDDGEEIPEEKENNDVNIKEMEMFWKMNNNEEEDNDQESKKEEGNILNIRKRKKLRKQMLEKKKELEENNEEKDNEEEDEKAVDDCVENEGNEEVVDDVMEEDEEEENSQNVKKVKATKTKKDKLEAKKKAKLEMKKKAKLELKKTKLGKKKNKLEAEEVDVSVNKKKMTKKSEIKKNKEIKSVENIKKTKKGNKVIKKMNEEIFDDEEEEAECQSEKEANTPKTKKTKKLEKKKKAILEKKKNNLNETKEISIDEMFKKLEKKTVNEKKNKKSKLNAENSPTSTSTSNKKSKSDSTSDTSGCENKKLKKQTNTSGVKNKNPDVRTEVSGDKQGGSNNTNMKKIMKKKADSKDTKEDSEASSNLPEIKDRKLGTARPDYAFLKRKIENESDDEGSDDEGFEDVFDDVENLKLFEEEKKAQEEQNKVKNADNFMEGWGSWGGPGIVPSAKRRKRFTIEAPKGQPNKYSKVGNVIYNEKNDVHDNLRKLMVTDLPYPYTTVKDFEASIRQPISSTFVPETAHKKLIAPAVVHKMGQVIYPMTEEALVKDHDYKKQKVSKLEEKLNKKLNFEKKFNSMINSKANSKSKSRFRSKTINVNKSKSSKPLNV